jgi:hypothetical protein
VSNPPRAVRRVDEAIPCGRTAAAGARFDPKEPAMRYLMMVKVPPDSDYEAGKPPSPALMAGMGKLTEEMMRAGVVLSSEGLHPSRSGVRLRHAGGRTAVTDGPFTEAKELVGGFAIVRAASKAEAIALAQRVVDVHVAAGVPEVAMEIRPLYDMHEGCTPPA